MVGQSQSSQIFYYLERKQKAEKFSSIENQAHKLSKIRHKTQATRFSHCQEIDMGFFF